MIAELFYPRELKDAIKDLRAKGDLNEEAVSEIGKSIRMPLILGGIAIIGLMIDDLSSWYWYAGVAFATLIACHLFVRRAVNVFAMPYTYGETITGEILEIRFGKPDPAALRGWRFKYNATLENGVPVKKLFDVVLKENMVSPPLKTGDTIKIYLHPEKSKYHAPYLPAYFKKLCLSKQKINEIVNQET